MSLLRTLNSIILHPLNKKRKKEALFGFLKWQIGSRLVPGDVIFDWVNGAKFIVRPGETGLTQNIYCGLHEFHEMAYVLHVLNSDDLFIDVGANVGAYTILACAVNGARGYCFEPVPATFQRLVANIKLNDLLGRVKAYNVGLADEEGELLFTSGLDSTNHMIAEGESHTSAIKVKVIPLDAAIAEESPSLIKIDVEGLETLVVNGMLRTIEKPALHSVIMELNGSGERYGFDENVLIERMQAFGFRKYEYEPFSKTLKPISRKDIHSSNTLFVRNEPFIRQRLAGTLGIKFGSLEI